jgi:carnitine 3-dehydrogenase
LDPVRRRNVGAQEAVGIRLLLNRQAHSALHRRCLFVDFPQGALLRWRRHGGQLRHPPDLGIKAGGRQALEVSRNSVLKENDLVNKQIRRVTVVGTGLIGASWAAQYLASGLDVVATDPAPNAEANLRKCVDDAWELLTLVGLAPDASRDRLTFTADMKAAVSNADFVQENVPERPLLKNKVFTQMDEVAPPDTILASSASGISMDVIQAGCKQHPERCVLGHPFNPPHVIPLVEVVGGAKTTEAVIERTIAFYASIGKKPIRLHKVIPGHVGNRLQAALYREVLYLIQQGVLSVEDADLAVCYGPGLRWGVMGPSLQWHLGGGSGGIEQFVKQFLDGFAGLMKKLEMPDVTPALMQTVIDGVLKEANGQSVEQLAQAENKLVIELLALRAKAGGTVP